MCLVNKICFLFFCGLEYSSLVVYLQTICKYMYKIPKSNPFAAYNLIFFLL